MLESLQAFLLGQRPQLKVGAYPALSDALKKLLGKKAWKRLLLATPDRRQLTEEAATLRGVSELEIIKQLAELIGIPVFFKPKVPDLAALPSGIILPELRKLGLLPLTVQGAVVGIVCVDPSALNQLPELYSGSNLYLSSWQNILAVLDESEQRYHQELAQKKNQHQAKLLDLFAKILGRLLEQAAAHQAHILVLSADGAGLNYSYKDASAKEWCGCIEDSIGVELGQYLEQAIVEGLTNIDVVSSEGLHSCAALRAEHGRMFLQKTEEPFMDAAVKNNLESAKVVGFPRLVKVEKFSKEVVGQDCIQAKVLLVDDNPTFASVLKKFLEKQGLTVESCASAEEAWDWLKTLQGPLPELIISDLHMPGMGGMEFIKMLKKEPKFNNLSIIALTSDETSETEIGLLEVGADAFVTKTKDPRILGLHVRRLIGVQRAA